MLYPQVRSLCLLFAVFYPALAQGPDISTNPPLPNAVVGVAYSVTFTASGGYAPYTWSIASGTLPPGLRLNSTNGLMDGSPATNGVFTFILQVTDSLKATDARAYTVTVR